MNFTKDQSLVFILISGIAFFSNSGGLLMANLVFDTPNEVDSMPQIFYLICGLMILISIIELIYGIYLR